MMAELEIVNYNREELRKLAERLDQTHDLIYTPPSPDRNEFLISSRKNLSIAKKELDKLQCGRYSVLAWDKFCITEKLQTLLYILDYEINKEEIAEKLEMAPQAFVVSTYSMDVAIPRGILPLDEYAVLLGSATNEFRGWVDDIRILDEHKPFLERICYRNFTFLHAALAEAAEEAARSGLNELSSRIKTQQGNVLKYMELMQHEYGIDQQTVEENTNGN